MWAEWMTNFDLTVTKEDIEEYKKMRSDKQWKKLKQR